MDRINISTNGTLLKTSTVSTNTSITPIPQTNKQEEEAYPAATPISEAKEKTTQEETKSANEKEREKIEKSANEIFDALNTGLALKFHEKSGEWYAVILNKVTQEVVKEVPPKYMLDLHASLKQMIGVFLDKRV